METGRQLEDNRAGSPTGRRWMLVLVWLLASLVAYVVIAKFPSVQAGRELSDGTTSACDSVAISCSHKEVLAGAAKFSPGHSESSRDAVATPAKTIDQSRFADATDSPAHAYLAPEPHSLQPYKTLAEVCSATANGAFRCVALDGVAGGQSTGNRAETVIDYSYTIAGRVLTDRGRGLEGVSVVASPDRLAGGMSADGLRFRTVTDSIGAYSLDGLPEGEYTIRSSAHGNFAPARVAVRAGLGTADLVVARRALQVLEGQVIAITGEPLEGVAVMPNLIGQPSVLTDDNGFFRLEVALQADVANFSVRFERPGYSTANHRIEFRREDIGTVEMRPVELWTSLQGNVVSTGGEALAQRVVELRMRSSGSRQKTLTDKDGHFEFSIVEAPADYELVIFGSNDFSDVRRSLQVDDEIAPLEIVLEPYEYGAVSGRLVNLNREPVANFDLVLRNSRSRQPNHVVTTDASGRFEVDSMPAGEIVIAGRGSTSLLARGISLRPGETLDIPIMLDWGAHEMRGIVLDRDGNPVPGARAVLRWSHSAAGITAESTRRTATDAQGYFVFAGIGPGPHTVRIDAPGFRTLSLEHDIDRQGNDLIVRMNQSFRPERLAGLN